MNVLVAGHSFVRRLAFDIKVRNLSWQVPGASIILEGKGGATICGPKPFDREIDIQFRTTKFSLLILDIGSNDLDPVRHPNWCLPKLAEALVSKASLLATRFNISVVICLPIPRDEEQFPGSFQRTTQFNTILKGLVDKEVRVHVWAHKGLFKRDRTYLDKHGVHLNSKGQIKYFHSIRAAIKFHLARLA